MTIQNNPLMSHPLADQATWWDDDKSIKEVESIRNHKIFLPEIFPTTKPNKIYEGGKEIYPPNGGLSFASVRTFEGISKNSDPSTPLGG